MTGNLEIDFENIPDTEFSKQILWNEAVDQLFVIMVMYAEAFAAFLLFYRKYAILGHLRFGRLFMRIARNLYPDSSLSQVLFEMKEKGNLYDGKSTTRGTPEAKTAAGSEDGSIS